jgi:methyl-accepting chemotaxis protein
MKENTKDNMKFKSIRVKLSVILLLICIVPLFSLGIISYKKSYNILYNKLQVTSNQTLDEVNRGITDYFTGMGSMLKFLSVDDNVEQVSSNPALEASVFTTLSKLHDSNPDVKNIYFGESSKKMIIYPEQKLPDNYDPTTRPWYQDAIKNSGNVVFSEPYKDAGTGNLIISVSKTVEYNGQIVGVVSMDLDLGVLSKQLSNIKIGNKGYVYITNSQGMMIAHPDKSLWGKNTVTTLNFWKDAKVKDHGFVNYVYNGENKFAIYTTNKITGWKLIGAMDQAELLVDANSIRDLTIVYVGIIAILALIISLFISKSITKHIIILKKLFKKASEGDISVRVDIKSRDEFEELGDNFNLMLENIGNLINKVKKSADTVLLTSEAISMMSNETTSSIKEVAITVDQIALGASAQARDITDGVEYINVLAGKIDNISGLASEMNSVSKDTNKLSQEGLRIMANLTSKTEESNNKSAKASSVVDDMNKSTAEIGVITDTINSIAEQTNLLALNAAIEAARAGEAGRGFSVVADEIRKLAEQSTYATKQIQELIQNIRSKSELAVESMSSTKAITGEQTEAVNQTKDIFGKILDSVKLLMEELEQVDGSIVETNISKDEIVDKMQNISAVAEENSASTEEVSASTEELTAVLSEFSHTAEELKELVDKLDVEINNFKLV